MESFAEFIAPIQWFFWKAYHFASGQFLPSTCGWCRPMFWVVEVGLVIFFLMSAAPRGPSPRNSK